ncbi:hypothetical protein [Tahibacter sp.]|uniref:hypothetical protein n=1 Tax=Tahibacter sp. TaxID=2056211 RepID=UPI0028C47E28|nr:hypothetical protein [Tahibacter sp.]
MPDSATTGVDERSIAPPPNQQGEPVQRLEAAGECDPEFLRDDLGAVGQWILLQHRGVHDHGIERVAQRMDRLGGFVRPRRSIGVPDGPARGASVGQSAQVCEGSRDRYG